MSLSTIYKMYFEVFVVFAVTIIYLIKVIRRKPIITLTDACGRKKEHYQKRINLVLKVFLGVALTWVNSGEPLLMVRDLPYAIKNEYKTFEGYTTSKSTGKSNMNFHKRIFNIKNEEEEIHIKTYTYGVEEGVYMEVNYLPNSKFATVIYRSDKPDE